MSKILILLENEYQYREFVNHKEYNNSQRIICALAPFAIDFCEKNNLPFVVPEDYFTEEEYYRNKKLSETKIKELIKLLNGYSSKISLDKIGFSLELGNYFFSSLYIVTGALHLRSFLLFKIIEKENPDQIIVFRLVQDSPLYLEFRPDPRGNSYSELLSNSPYKYKSRFITYRNKHLCNSKFLSKGNIKKALKQVITIFPLIHQYYYFIKNDIKLDPLQNLSFNYKKNVLLLGAVYNWKYVIDHLKVKLNSRISWVNAEKISRPPKRLRKDLFKELIGWEGVFLGFNISALLYEQMGMVEITFREMIKSFNKYKKWIGKFNMVLASNVASPEQNYIAHIARIQRIPVVLYQHGEMNLYNDSLFSEAEEIRYIDYYLSFGDAVNNKYLEYLGKYEDFKGPVSIGSSTLDTLASLKMNSNKYILYASSKYLLNSTPFIDSMGVDIRLFQAQKKILIYLEDLATSNPRYKIVWKLDPTKIHGDSPFESRVKNVRIVRSEKKFTELVLDASVVILDSPGTTCLEVCATCKPVFTLLNRIKWFPEAQDLLKRRAMVAYTPEELIGKIDRYLKIGEYPADINNRDFIKRYGTYLDDGKSAERAIDFISHLVNHKNV